MSAVAQPDPVLARIASEGAGGFVSVGAIAQLADDEAFQGKGDVIVALKSADEAMSRLGEVRESIRTERERIAADASLSDIGRADRLRQLAVNSLSRLDGINASSVAGLLDQLLANEARALAGRAENGDGTRLTVSDKLAVVTATREVHKGDALKLMDFLVGAISDGDAMVARSYLSISRRVSGLPADKFDELRTLWIESTSPEQARVVASLRSVAATLRRRAELVQSDIDGLSGDDALQRAARGA